jgi:hypothetical protein
LKLPRCESESRDLSHTRRIDFFDSLAHRFEVGDVDVQDKAKQRPARKPQRCVVDDD